MCVSMFVCTITFELNGCELDICDLDIWQGGLITLTLLLKSVG